MQHTSKISLILEGILILSGFAFLILNNASCTKTETLTEYIHDTTTVHDTTTENLALIWLGSGGAWADVFCDPTPEPDSVDVKKEWGGNSHMFPFKTVHPGYVEIHDTMANTPGTTYTIKIASNIGNAQGSIALPETTYITQPTYNDTLPIGNVTTSWAVSQGADFYELDIDISAYDILGDYIQDEYIDTFLTNVSYIIPATYFNITGAAYYEVWFRIYPEAGPMPTPGIQSNMTGTLKGFLVAENDEDWVYFYVGTPVKSSQQHKKRKVSIEDRKNAYLHALGIKLDN